MKKVVHWKRSFKCKHHGDDIEAALVSALRCKGLTLEAVPLMKVLLEDTGEAKYLPATGRVLVFRTED